MSPSGVANVTLRLDALYPEAKQDLKDGAALRRLREALPEGWTWGVYQNRSDNGEMVPVVWAGRGSRYERLVKSGATIAEAADKCREALQKGGD